MTVTDVSGTGRKRVLVVDDEPAIREVCRRALAGEGYEVYLAEDGRVAQALIGERSYALCLLDLKMPVMSGQEIFDWLQRSCPSRVETLIFTTGSLVNGQMQDFLQRCAKPILLKPFTIGQLKAAVSQALRQAK